VLGPIGIAIALVVTPIVLLARFFSWFESGTWFIVPSGIVVRRPTFGVAYPLSDYFTRRDSILQIEPMRPGWRVTLYRPDCPAQRIVTDLECNVLLAAWQSPLEPPPRELLAELSRGTA
jgi:hypothetical protein